MCCVYSSHWGDLLVLALGQSGLTMPRGFKTGAFFLSRKKYKKKMIYGNVYDYAHILSGHGYIHHDFKCTPG